MKINRILSGEAVPRGERMEKKKDKNSQPKRDSVVLSPEAITKQGLEKAAKSGKSNVIARKSSAVAPEAKPADSYRPGRPAAETPLRAEKIEHAKMMIESKGYDNPQVVAAIIDRLVFALKE